MQERCKINSCTVIKRINKILVFINSIFDVMIVYQKESFRF